MAFHGRSQGWTGYRILAAPGWVAGVVACFLAMMWPLPARAENHPALNPPHVELELVAPAPRALPLAVAPTTEWTFHKTADSSHPDGTEQQMMWLMNRARSDPSAEGNWLATSTDPDVAGGRTYFGVDTAKLIQEFNGYAAKPPAAFDVRLYNAAKEHSQDLINRDAQDHTGQIEAVNASGFQWLAYRGNVFSYAASGLNAHAAYNIDWGNEPDGMQTGRGHRMAIMSVDGDYTNVGLATLPESNPATSVGPQVNTGNYCKANTGYADHYNTFIVGTVWQDQDGDDMYDPGEGMSGVTVTPSGGVYYAITSNGGGYAIPVTSNGNYTITFSGGGVNTTRKTITFSGQSVLVDLKYTGQAATPADILFLLKLLLLDDN